VGKNAVDNDERGENSYSDLKKRSHASKVAEKKTRLLCASQITVRQREKSVDLRFNGSTSSTESIKKRNFIIRLM